MRNRLRLVIAAAACIVLLAERAGAGPAAGVAAGQMSDLVGEVAFYCGSGSNGRGGPNLAKPCDPASSVVTTSPARVINVTCGTTTNICVPHVLGEAQADLFVNAEELVQDPNPACSPVPFNGCKIGLDVWIYLVDQYGHDILGYDSQHLQSPIFARRSTCPRAEGNNFAAGFRVAEWFPLSAKECVVDTSVDFGGALVADDRNFPSSGWGIGDDLLLYAEANLGLDPLNVVPLSIVPSGTRAGESELSPRAGLGHSGPNSQSGRYPVTVRFAEVAHEPLLLELGRVAGPGSSTIDVVAKGSRVYGAGGNSLQIFDVADVTHPQLIGAVSPVAFQAQDVERDGDVAFVATWDGLHVIRVADPDNPVEIAHLGPYELYDVELVGHLLYLAGRDGLRIFDVANPSAIVELGSINTDYSTLVKVAGGLAYVGGGAGLHIVDVSNPSNPVELGYVSGPYYSITDMVVAGSKVYAVGNGFQVIDVTNPLSPVQLGWIESWRIGSPTRVALQGSTAYLTTYLGLRIIDVSNPATPVEVGSLQPAGFSWLTDLEIDGHLAYLADSAFGLRVVEVVDRSHPVEVGSLPAPNANRVEWASGQALLGGYDGLQVVDVSTPSNPLERGSIGTALGVTDVEADGTLVYLASSTRGLRIFDASNPASPVELSALGGSGVDVDLDGSLAYLLEPDRLRVVDVADPSNPRQVGSFDFGNGGVAATDVEIDGSHAYLQQGYEGLRVIDVADPAHPAEVAHLGTPASAVKVVGSRAYLAVNGLRVLDVADPTSPVEIGALILPESYNQVEVAGRHAYLSGERLRVIDITGPQPVDAFGRDASGGRIDLAGSLLYRASSSPSPLRIFGYAREADPDLDGLPTALEAARCTNPYDRDSDEDGLADGEEDVDLDGTRDPGELDPCDRDTDGDGIQDGTERQMTTGTPDVDGAGPLLATAAATFVPDADGRKGTDPLEVDTDADGLQDGVEDANHNGRLDPGETDPASSAACDDDLDNDLDGLVDLADPGCADADDTSERSPLFLCDDGLDNDGDQLVDLEDPVCAGPTSAGEASFCQDGLDNDGDGKIDFDGGASVCHSSPCNPPLKPRDPQCTGPSRNRESCGLGFEVAPLLAGLLAMRTRRRRNRASAL